MHSVVWVHKVCSLHNLSWLFSIQCCGLVEHAVVFIVECICRFYFHIPGCVQYAVGTDIFNMQLSFGRLQSINLCGGHWALNIYALRLCVGTRWYIPRAETRGKKFSSFPLSLASHFACKCRCLIQLIVVCSEHRQCLSLCHAAGYFDLPRLFWLAPLILLIFWPHP